MTRCTLELDNLLDEVIDRYSWFDQGHDVRHVKAVRDRATELARKHAPKVERLVEVAAVYHDSALGDGRAGHEVRASAEVMINRVLTKYFSIAERTRIANAVLHHRASTGTPTTIEGRILSDADRSPISTSHAYMRAYSHGVIHFPELSHEEQLLRASRHLFEKYGPSGYGRKTYFPETEQRINDAMSPIFKAYLDKDLEAMQTILDGEPLLQNALS